MRLDSLAAWSRFHEQVAKQGGRVVEPQWLGTNKRHRIICGVGHEATSCPGDVNRGTGICRTCSGCDTAAVERAFRVLIAERGWTIVEPMWLGSKKPHRVICTQGHQTTPMPTSIVNLGTGCIVCAGKDQGTAWRLFCQLIEERGGQVLEPKPLGNNVPHRVRCPEGHETTATPSSVRIGLAFCHLCRRTSTARAEQHFRDLVNDLGGVILEPTWLGSAKPHRVRCGQGHETTPRPSEARQTRSLCRVCAGHDSATSWRIFQACVAEQGGTVVETKWLGNKKHHRVVCKEGHKCSVIPNNVQQGCSICRTCAYKVWDVFYIVVNDSTSTVKFGVTSHDPRARLRIHRADGFTRVIKTITGLADAFALERKVLSSLRAAGAAAVRGYEYYDIAVLPDILSIVDTWSGTP